MSETPTKYVDESDREKARTIAKLCWYIGPLPLERLGWYLGIPKDEVKNIIGSDEHLAAVEELIRTHPDRTGESIEDWWAKKSKRKSSAFAKRMRLSEEDISKLVEKVTESNREKARTIAKLCWYKHTDSPVSLEILGWYLGIPEDEVENIIGSDEHLAAIEELIRTRPQREPVSIEEWWAKEWKHKPSAFARRMRLSEEDASKLVEKVLSRT